MLTIENIHQDVYQLYTLLRKNHFIPRTLVILGRRSLLPGACLVDLLNPSYVRYADKVNKLQECKLIGDTLVFVFNIEHEDYVKWVRRSLLGRTFKIACLYKSCVEEPDFCVYVVPPEVQLTLPLRTNQS